MNAEEIKKRAEAYIREEKDADFRSEVEELLKKGDMNELTERFYKSLEFGTGGLRGIIGGGTNRMNTLMIHKATQGLANYCIKAMSDKASKGELKAAIAYDSRRYSDVFAEETACIFAANGFKVYLFTGLRPTPELSFAIRTFVHCAQIRLYNRRCRNRISQPAPVQRLQSLLVGRRAGNASPR